MAGQVAPSSSMKDKALVLGAGIQGICCALALRKKGYDVTLIDRSQEPFSQTSMKGEAKIHLGYVYANDRSFRTASLLLKSAMHFGPLLDAWTNHQINWRSICSTPFTYIVHRDSMVAVDTLQHHYDRIAVAYKAYQQQGLHYVGHSPSQLLTQCQPLPSYLNPLLARAAIATPELAIQTQLLKPVLIGALQQEYVRFLPNRRVRTVERAPVGFRINGDTITGQSWSDEGSIVVNCLWDGRLQLDSSLGLHPKQPWVYRLKHSLLGHLPQKLTHVASHTIVLGPFGDLVTYPDGLTYLSWYPTCLRGWSDQLQPPDHWPNQTQDPQSTQDWQQATLNALDAIVPGLRQFEIKQANAGVIFSWGETDIDDPDSLLHYRYNIGVNGFDGYFSVDTGKFTSAPYFAQSLIDQLG